MSRFPLTHEIGTLQGKNAADIRKKKKLAVKEMLKKDETIKEGCDQKHPHQSLAQEWTRQAAPLEIAIPKRSYKSTQPLDH